MYALFQEHRVDLGQEMCPLSMLEVKTLDEVDNKALSKLIRYGITSQKNLCTQGSENSRNLLLCSEPLSQELWATLALLSAPWQKHPEQQHREQQAVICQQGCVSQ